MTSGNTIDPARAETGDLFDLAIERYAETTSIIAPGQHVIGIRDQAEDGTIMGLRHGGVRFRAEKVKGSITRSHDDGVAYGNGTRDRSTDLKLQAALLQLGFREAAPPIDMPLQVRRHAARQASNPSFSPMFSRSRPMNTTRDTRGLSSGHGPIGDPSISMCTPWKT